MQGFTNFERREYCYEEGCARGGLGIICDFGKKNDLVGPQNRYFFYANVREETIQSWMVSSFSNRGIEADGRHLDCIRSKGPQSEPIH
jgi:hypothetical protein